VQDFVEGLAVEVCGGKMHDGSAGGEDAGVGIAGCLFEVAIEAAGVVTGRRRSDCLGESEAPGV